MLWVSLRVDLVDAALEHVRPAHLQKACYTLVFVTRNVANQKFIHHLAFLVLLLVNDGNGIGVVMVVLVTL